MVSYVCPFDEPQLAARTLKYLVLLRHLRPQPPVEHRTIVAMLQFDRRQMTAAHRALLHGSHDS
jgi:hypothetical protein